MNFNASESRTLRVTIAVATAAICAVVIAAIGFGTSPRPVSAASSTNLSTMGNGKPSCQVTVSNGRKTCIVSFQVTGFQTKVRGKSNPFRVKRDGKIVSWGVSVGSPSKNQREAGADLYGTSGQGGHPVVRLVVLSKVPNSKNSYRLARQSPLMRLNQHYGSKPVFTLNKRLTVKEGQIIGISVYTWAPNMTGFNYTKRSSWTASANNKNGNCAKIASSNPRTRAQYKVSPQKSVNSKRTYACQYGDLLLYSARIVPKPSNPASAEKSEAAITLPSE